VPCEEWQLVYVNRSPQDVPLSNLVLHTKFALKQFCSRSGEITVIYQRSGVNDELNIARVVALNRSRVSERDQRLFYTISTFSQNFAQASH
jgi:hypothetical protein